MESSHIKEEPKECLSEEETCVLLLGWDEDLRSTMGRPTPISEVDFDDVKMEDEMTSPIAFVSVGCDISTADCDKEENFEEEEVLVNFEGNLDLEEHEDPLAIKKEIKSEEALEQKGTSAEEVMTSIIESSRQPVCCIYHEIVEVSSDVFTRMLPLMCDSCHDILKMKSLSEWSDWKCELYQICVSCVNVIHNSFDFVVHDCLRVNLFWCDKCRISFDKKDNIVKHVTECYKGRECMSNYEFEISSCQDVNNADSCSVNNVIDEKKTKKKIMNDQALKGKNDVNEKKRLTFQYCKGSFKKPSSLKQHLIMRTVDSRYNCKYCNKGFYFISGLQNHLRIHTGEKPFICKNCNKRFKQLGHLQEHVRIHTGEKPFICKYCKKGFTHSSSLGKHILSHTGERPFICKYCKRGFTVKGHLRQHLLIHTGEKPFICNYCNKGFARSGTLQGHLRLHTGEKPCICEFCKKRFTHSSTLRKHLRLHIL